MSPTHRNYCCFCIPFRLAVAVFSVLAIGLGGLCLWNVWRLDIEDNTAKIVSYVATSIYGILGLSGLFSVIFKRYALAKNFSVLWWTVTVLTTILACVNMVLLATKEKDQVKSICQTTLLSKGSETTGESGIYPADVLADDVDNCYKYVLIIAGAAMAVQVLVMLVGGWVASRYTSEVKHRKSGLTYIYGQGYVQPQAQSSAAHPYTSVGGILFYTAADTAQNPLDIDNNNHNGNNNNNGNTNPQQVVGMEQSIDYDTYGGQTPLASYPTDSHASSKLTSKKYKNTSRPSTEIDTDVQDLVESLTLKELVGQITQIQIGMLIDQKGELDMKKVQYWVGELGVGSFLDTPTNHGGKYIAYSARKFSKIVDAIQKVAVSSGKRIPMIYGLDSVHGANYVDGAVLFPQQIGLAATFNTTAAYELGRITARDTRAAGIPWVFAPILDVAVHKLWPRVYETFGEDPYVVSEMGSALIRGLQGDYKKDRTRVASCMKHFIGYSASRNGQDKSSAWIPDNYLMDYFVPPFQAAIDAGVATAMETYIDVNGQPVISSNFYLTELLRKRLGFEGMLVTDWQEVDRLFTEHRTATSLKDATFQCLKQTSVDMVMVPESDSFSKDATALVQEKKLDRARLVESVAKVIQLKKDLGLFDQPFSDPKLLSYVGSQQDIDAAKDTARESITLLKNEKSILPINKSHSKSKKRIFVTGPAADSIRALSGGWSIKWQGAEKNEWYQGRGETIFQGLKKEFGSKNVKYAPSVDFKGDSLEDDDNKDNYLDAAKEADVVVICLGEHPYAEIVGNINELDLPWGQLEVVEKVHKKVKGSKTKVVLVLVEGRPRGLENMVEKVDAVVMAYLPGPWGGHPIAQVLSGTVNPSGRLPLTYPSGPGDMAANYYRSGIDPYEPLFSFSAGLSYSKVEYWGLKLSSSQMRARMFEEAESGRSMNAQKDDEDIEKDEEEGSKQNQAPTNIESSYKRADAEGSIVPSMEGMLKQFSEMLLPKKVLAGPATSDMNTLPLVSSNGIRSTIRARIMVENTSDRPVKETVFWYITQDYRSDIMPEAFMLKGFEKVDLEPGESKEVKFRITRSALAYHDRSLRKKVENGSFTLTVNAMRPEAQSVKFQIV
ncbi:hypothetical protein BG011_006688 [Mortierella polycephala]|uniref:beta-glucosidase n=1 Tax=Mortierella polycephala TaxID=41804 RepID=A0A9P6PUP0_9FUNG|nr:hypothetical protein BG011_006688 [Mortierella polycephala]